MTAFQRIAVIGCGLIGGSIARAALEKGAAGAVSLFDFNEAALKRAGEIGFGEPRANIADAVKDADAVFLCVPVGAMKDTGGASIAAMKPDAILTDVGSVKGSVAKDLRALAKPGVHVIPGHPIAGTEKSGPDAGFASLFEGRWCILTPEDSTDPAYQAASDRLAPSGKSSARRSRGWTRSATISCWP